MYNTSKDASAAAKTAKRKVEKLKEKIESTTDKDKLKSLKKELDEAKSQQDDAEKAAKRLKEFEAELKAKMKFEEKAAKAQDAAMKEYLAKSMSQSFPFQQFFGDLKDKLTKGITWIYLTYLKYVHNFIKTIVKFIVNKNKENDSNKGNGKKRKHSNNPEDKSVNREQKTKLTAMKLSELANSFKNILTRIPHIFSQKENKGKNRGDEDYTR